MEGPLGALSLGPAAGLLCRLPVAFALWGRLREDRRQTPQIARLAGRAREKGQTPARAGSLVSRGIAALGANGAHSRNRAPGERHSSANAKGIGGTGGQYSYPRAAD